jgi:ferredoxin
MRNRPYIRWGSLLLATIFALPIPVGDAQGLFLWASPFLAVHAWLAGLHVTVFHWLSVAVLLLAFFIPRGFCRYGCPTGVFCDLASQCGSKNNLLYKIKPIQKTICICGFILAGLGIPLFIFLDPINLFYAFFDILQPLPLHGKIFKAAPLLLIVLLNVWRPHLWCQRVCPLGGMQDILTDGKTKLKAWSPARTPDFIPSRRAAITGAIAVGCGFLLRPKEGKAASALRPPGAAAEAQFQARCARCGNCVKACPTKIIHSTLPTTPLRNWLTPQVYFHDAYCLPDCNRCGTACPSGAISPFTLADKAALFIGTAKIDLPRCRLTEGLECDRCKAVCPYDAVTIKTDEDNFTAYPEIKHAACVGCGACEIVCPAHVIEIAPLARG